jgi:hypothetical protein
VDSHLGPAHSFGFTIYKFFQYVRENAEGHPAASALNPRRFGMSMIVVGLGAVVGVAKGRKAKKQAKAQAEQQAVEQANAQAAGTKDTFKKAYSACIEGKGYTVK